MANQQNSKSNLAKAPVIDPGVKERRKGMLFPLELKLAAPAGLYGGNATRLTLHTGLTTFVGPNGTGKTQVLRLLRDALGKQAGVKNVRLLAAGRSAPFESYRGAIITPGSNIHQPAAVGNVGERQQRWSFESLTGDMLALEQRADLLVKVEARMQVLFRRRLRLRWSQSGLELSFLSAAGEEYPVNVEASGVIHLVGLVAALYDDEVGALLIDEPEISLHPQLQGFLLQEILQVAGNPYDDPSKKLIVLSTHAPSFLMLRRLEQLSNLVFFTSGEVPPRQISPDAGELKSRKLSGLIARLSETHRVAFFAQTVLLVEGPSDEIIVSGLANRLEWPLAGSGAQVVPVTGKGEMAETVKLFRFMGKRVAVLVDLDALVDDNALVNSFAQIDGGREVATRTGHDSLTELDRPIRDRLVKMVNDNWGEIEHIAKSHAYLVHKSPDTPDDIARRRALAAMLLSRPEAELAGLPMGKEWVALRKRLGVLLDALEAVGCFVLRRGTIEDYYLRQAVGRGVGKPESASNETSSFDQDDEVVVRQQYADVLRAMAYAAPVRQVDENVFLRGMLGGLIATAFQHLKVDMPDVELNAFAAGGNPASLSVFKLENVSSGQAGRAIRVHIVSPLFARNGFPFDVRFEDSLNMVVEQKLPSSNLFR